MIIATLKEISADENRVAISPDTCKQYCKRGFSVYIEKNAVFNNWQVTEIVLNEKDRFWKIFLYRPDK